MRPSARRGLRGAAPSKPPAAAGAASLCVLALYTATNLMQKDCWNDKFSQLMSNEGHEGYPDCRESLVVRCAAAQRVVGDAQCAGCEQVPPGAAPPPGAAAPAVRKARRPALRQLPLSRPAERAAGAQDGLPAALVGFFEECAATLKCQVQPPVAVDPGTGASRLVTFRTRHAQPVGL